MKCFPFFPLMTCHNVCFNGSIYVDVIFSLHAKKNEECLMMKINKSPDYINAKLFCKATQPKSISGIPPILYSLFYEIEPEGLKKRAEEIFIIMVSNWFFVFSKCLLNLIGIIYFYVILSFFFHYK